MSSRPRLTLFLIVTLIALPFAAGTALYLSGWRPAQTVNHGLLIAPPKTVSAPEEWQGKWSLLLIHDGPCGEPCVERLHQLRRVRVSLGQQMGRTRLVWMGTAIAGEGASLQALMPDLAVLEKRSHSLENLPPGSVILVDPSGLAMMRYLPGADPRGMRDDLERLLKYVWNA